MRIEEVACKSGKECSVSVIDISERKRAEEELTRKELEIMQQSRHAALGEMLGTISHHWRQPLNAIGLIIQELEFAFEGGSPSADHLKARVSNAMQIILSLSRTHDNFRNFFTPDKGKSRFKVNQVSQKRSPSSWRASDSNRLQKHWQPVYRLLPARILPGAPQYHLQCPLSAVRKAQRQRQGNISSFTEEG